MEADKTLAPAERPTLVQVAHAQSNALYDVVALLAAIADRIEARADIDARDSLHHTLRLTDMARAQVDNVIKALDSHI